ncbi:contactin-1, partial [Biomphalaria glabrata]
LNGQEIPSQTSATYLVVHDGGYEVYDVTCTAQLSGQEAVSSRNRFRVSAYNTVPTASTSKPLKGGRVIITCGDLFLLETVKYVWLKDSALIERQFDRKLQLDNVNTTDSGIYSCGIDASDLGPFLKGVKVEVQ